jgi:predicted alpha/beta-hydrolase family hydrolase
VEWSVPVGAERVSAVYDAADTASDAALFICAHGAGGNMSDRGVLASAAAMRANGIGVVRFNFIYKERGSGRPDTMPRLTATVAAVAEYARAELRPARLIIGGRSMGGRAASMLAADGYQAEGLLLLAYPLHPPGKPEQLRDAHLQRIRIPVLCFNGTRDEFCTRSLMERAIASVSTPWTMQWVEGADHSFHVLKSSGRTDAQVMTEIGRVAGEWVNNAGTSRTPLGA